MAMVSIRATVLGLRIAGYLGEPVSEVSVSDAVGQDRVQDGHFLIAEDIVRGEPQGVVDSLVRQVQEERLLVERILVLEDLLYGLFNDTAGHGRVWSQGLRWWV